jgi:GT2 family glycosyltransferase
VNPASIPFVTVVVPTYNDGAHLRQCLDSLIQSDYPAGHFEVLVVDGGSDDGSQSIVLQLAEEAGFIRMLGNPRRVAAAGVNIGIESAAGDVIIILSAHSYVASDFIRQSVHYLSHTEASCVGGPIQSISESFVGKTIALAMSSPFGVGNALFRYSRREQYVDTVAFGAYRRKVFHKIGSFDETLVYNEDDEFNSRLRERGGKIFLTPAIKSFYYTRSSLRQLWQQYFHYGLGKVRVIQRHPYVAMTRHFVPFFFVATLLVSGLLGLLDPIWWKLSLWVLGSYLAASLIFSLSISARNGWRHLPVLPVVFACLHFAYGLGFLAGLLKLAWEVLHRPPRQHIATDAHRGTGIDSIAGTESVEEMAVDS